MLDAGRKARQNAGMTGSARPWLFGALLVACFALTATGPAAAERRVALVIGNAGYVSLTALENPANDARRMAGLLAGHGFEILSCDGIEKGCFDLGRGALLDALDDFQDMAAGASVALVFYAGHGMQTASGNVLAPVDMEISCENWRARREVLLDDVLAAMADAREKIVILDACRNDPFQSQQCLERGARPLSFGSFAVPQSEARLLLMTSTQNGQLAQDGPPGGHSPFAEVLFHWMEAEPAIRYDQLLDRVTKSVVERTAVARFTQIPEILIRGGAPETCLAGHGCALDPAASALRTELETLREENARNQEFEEIVVALLRSAGHENPALLSDEERQAVFEGIMEAARSLAAREDGQGEPVLASLRQGDGAPAERLLAQDLAALGEDAYPAPIDDLGWLFEELQAGGADTGPDERELEASVVARHLAALLRPIDAERAARLHVEAARLDPDNALNWTYLAEAARAAGRPGWAEQAETFASGLFR